MTDNITQEMPIKALDSSIYGTQDSFRAALAKLGTESAPPSEEIPQDVQEATRGNDNDNEVESINTEDYDNAQEAASTEVESPQVEESTVETKGHLIPKSRFNQEIEKRKALEEQLTKEREERIRYETQLQMLNAMQQQSQQQQPQAQSNIEDIDPLDTDTYNYAKREIEALKNQLQNVAAETEARTREMQYHSLVSAQEAAFSKEHPDFYDAMKHVQQVEFNVAKDLLGDERAANEYVGAKLRDALTRSLSSGKNAAETIYNMAKTYGYSATKTQPKATPSKDIAAISKNMERAANTGHLGNSGAFNNMPTDIKAAFNKSGNDLSGVNPDAFHKMLGRLRA